jgi:hypothetical protein
LQVLILFSRSAIWVWRGQGLAFELAEDWQVDYASYAWQKLDPKVSPVFCFFLLFWAVPVPYGFCAWPTS